MGCVCGQLLDHRMNKQRSQYLISHEQKHVYACMFQTMQGSVMTCDSGLYQSIPIYTSSGNKVKASDYIVIRMALL